VRVELYSRPARHPADLVRSCVLDAFEAAL